MTHKLLVTVATLFFLAATSVFGGPPIPFLDDNEPGVNLPFSGDPNTTEEGCARDAARATNNDASGKVHNEFLDCDNWSFGAEEWGQAAFLQGAFVLGQSPFSSDGGWECEANVFDPDNPNGVFAGSPCANPTVRVKPTFKNQPLADNDGIPMRTDIDWVLSAGVRVSTLPGDTFGGDKLMEPGSRSGDGHRFFVLTGANNDNTIGGNPAEASSYLNGVPNRYRILHGPVIDGKLSETIIPGQLTEGTVTVHYKAANQRMDFWLDDTLVLADFESGNGAYDIAFIQIGGGGGSFENLLVDEVVLGVLASGEACGPQGPGASVPGDFNCDGLVDVADLGIVGANFNTTEVTYVDGDANLDNQIDVADLGVVGANWSAAQGVSLAQALNAAGLSALIPEPTTLVVLGTGLVVIARRRR